MSDFIFESHTTFFLLPRFESCVLHVMPRKGERKTAKEYIYMNIRKKKIPCLRESGTHAPYIYTFHTGKVSCWIFVKLPSLLLPRRRESIGVYTIVYSDFPVLSGSVPPFFFIPAAGCTVLYTAREEKMPA